MGDSFHDPKTEDDYIERIRDFSKELTGSRETYGEYGKIEHMSLAQLKDYYEGMFNSPEAQYLKDKERSDADASLGRDTDYDRMPKNLGMGRMESTMKVNEEQLKKLIKKEAKRLLEGRYAQLGEPESQPHLAEMQEIVSKLGTLANDLIDKLGGSTEIQDAQAQIDDAARSVSGAMESVRYSLEQQGISEQREADPRVIAMQKAVDLLSDLQFDSLEDALDNINTEVVRKLNIMLRELDYKRNKVGNISENERRFNEVFNGEGEN